MYVFDIFMWSIAWGSSIGLAGGYVWFELVPPVR
jgi:hypothetical protein